MFIVNEQNSTLTDWSRKDDTNGGTADLQWC